MITLNFNLIYWAGYTSDIFSISMPYRWCHESQCTKCWTLCATGA